MAGYVNGKIEIWCGDYAPYNLNILWYKRIRLSPGVFSYELLDYDNVSNTWSPIQVTAADSIRGILAGSNNVTIDNTDPNFPVISVDESIGEAPIDTFQYARQDGGWVKVLIPAGLTLGETNTTAYRGDRGKIAYNHSQADHAPSNAEANVIIGIQKNGVDLIPDSNRKVNVTVPTQPSDIGAATSSQGAKADTALQSFTETDPTVPLWAKTASKPTYTYSEVGAEPAKSENDNYITDDQLAKLDGIEAGAQVNDANTVIDANYVHTDNNLTDELISTINGAAPSVHNHSGQSINPDNIILSKQYTDLTMVDLAVGAVFYNVDQLCWLLKLSDVNYYNFGEELPMLSKNGDTSTHTEGTAVYISSGSGQLAVVKRTSSTIGKCNALATADVLNTGNGRGYYCFFGAVRQFPYTNVKKSTDNENTWVDGAELFLCSESGKYSTTKEDAPAKSTKIGTITNRSGANITVMFQPENSVSIDDLSDVDGTDTTIASGSSFLFKLATGVWKKILDTDFITYLSNTFQTKLTFSTDIEADKLSTTKVSAIKTFYDWAVGKFASLSGATFTGAISATNLSGTNNGNEVYIGSTTPAGVEEIWIDPASADMTTVDIPESTDKNYCTDFQKLNKFGSGANFTQFDANGQMKMYGNATVFEDLNFSPNSSGGTVVTLPDYVTINNVTHREFTSSNNQICADNKELPHAYKLSSSLTPHLHLFLKSGESAGTTGVTFTLYWEVRQTTGVTSGSLTLSATSAQLTANANKIDVHGTAFAGSAELGGHLSLRLARTAGDAGDVVVMTYGVHYELDSVGSNEITTK